MISYAGKKYWSFVSSLRANDNHTLVNLLLSGEGILIFRECQSASVKQRLGAFLVEERRKRGLPEKSFLVKK